MTLQKKCDIIRPGVGPASTAMQANSLTFRFGRKDMGKLGRSRGGSGPPPTPTLFKRLYQTTSNRSFRIRGLAHRQIVTGSSGCAWIMAGVRLELCSWLSRVAPRGLFLARGAAKKRPVATRISASDLRSKDLEKAGEGAGWGHSECHAPKYNDTTLRDALSLEKGLATCCLAHRTV